MFNLKVFGHNTSLGQSGGAHSSLPDDFKFPSVFKAKSNYQEYPRSRANRIKTRRSASLPEKSPREELKKPGEALLEEDRLPFMNTFSNFAVEGRMSPQYNRPKISKQMFFDPQMQISHHKKAIVERAPVKEWLFWDLMKMMQEFYGLKPTLPTGKYTFYIGKGNNSALVNQIMKNRYWWKKVDSPNGANFVWTQNRHKKTIEKLTSMRLECRTKSPDFPSSKVPSSLLKPQYEKSGWKSIKESEFYEGKPHCRTLCSNEMLLHNRIANNQQLTSKKLLLKNMKTYYTNNGVDPFSKIPLTFHIGKKINPGFSEFLNHHTPGSIWIIKPGEGTNRGQGITVTSNLSEIRETVYSSSAGRTYVIQKYICNPLLIDKRKFDIRCYALVACIGEKTQGYFYKDGYVRTATKEFSLESTADVFVHLTNDAIQKKSEEYGKFEVGNKLSYSELQKYMKLHCPEVNFQTQILTQIQNIVTDSIKAVAKYFTKGKNMFEVFGYDFMIDEEFNVWLIEANTNPCLELSSSYLAKLIPAMIDNAFKITVDPLFPPPPSNRFHQWIQEANIKNDFVLIFSQ